MGLKSEHGEFVGSGKSGWFEDELLEIQSQLPEGVYMQACINCLYSDYSPYGHGAFGCMMCFRNLKSEYLAVKCKDDFWAVHNCCDRMVQETFVCPAVASTFYTSETMPFRQPIIQLRSATGCAVLWTLMTLLVSVGGCRTRAPGTDRTLPVMNSADEVQYFPVGPEFKLPREAVALQKARDEEKRMMLLRDADNSNSSTSGNPPVDDPSRNESDE